MNMLRDIDKNMMKTLQQPKKQPEEGMDLIKYILISLHFHYCNRLQSCDVYSYFCIVHTIHQTICS